jgi:methionine-S-sulfoxide reductase
MRRIVLAGGCFWGVEAYYKLLRGVVETAVGYTNGNLEKPRYEDLTSHRASHAEAVAIVYDEKIITLEQLLEHLFRFIDPTSVDRQGHDIGHQYRTGIYYQDPDDLAIIKTYLSKKTQQFSRPLAIEVVPETGFYLAEEYHQDYLDKNPYGYCHVDLRLVKREERK